MSSAPECGKLVRMARARNDMTLRVLASRVGVSTAFLARFENGDGIPSEKNLVKIAKVLGLDADTVICLAGKVPSDVVDILLQRGMFEFIRRAAADGWTGNELLELLDLNGEDHAAEREATEFNRRSLRGPAATVKKGVTR